MLLPMGLLQLITCPACGKSDKRSGKRWNKVELAGHTRLSSYRGQRQVSRESWYWL